MAKKKVKQEIIRDCAKCTSSKIHNNTLYCTLSLKDANIYTESTIVSQKVCCWYKDQTTHKVLNKTK